MKVRETARVAALRNAYDAAAVAHSFRLRDLQRGEASHVEVTRTRRAMLKAEAALRTARYTQTVLAHRELSHG